MAHPPIFLRRSVLFMPASNERALEKAKALPCDGLIFDLEDAVSPDAKVAARENAVGAVRSGAYGGRELIIRINALDTAWGQDDLEAVKAVNPAAVLLPKVESADTVLEVSRALAGTAIALWAMLETPIGFLRAEDIVTASERLSALVIGPNDLVKSLRARRLPARAPIIPALSHALLVGRAYGKVVLDGVYNDFRDEGGFLAECLQGRDMGFDGKTLIHPSQIAGANEAFSPTVVDVAEAHKIVAAFEAAKTAGAGVAVLDGKMIEDLHVAEAKHLIGIANAIAKIQGT